MTLSVEFFIYLIAGLAIIALYYFRRKGLENLKPEMVPELDKKTFLQLRTLLETSYERTLYLGVSFLFLAYASARSSEIKLFCIILTVGLFIYNIPPRNKAMKILVSEGVEMKAMKAKA